MEAVATTAAEPAEGRAGGGGRANVIRSRQQQLQWGQLQVQELQQCEQQEQQQQLQQCEQQEQQQQLQQCQQQEQQQQLQQCQQQGQQQHKKQQP